MSDIRRPTEIHQRRHPWGLMVTVFVGAMFSIPLHPEHQDAVLRVSASGEVEYIRDETGRTWAIDPVPGEAAVVFTSGLDRVLVATRSVLDGDR